MVLVPIVSVSLEHVLWNARDSRQAKVLLSSEAGSASSQARFARGPAGLVSPDRALGMADSWKTQLSLPSSVPPSVTLFPIHFSCL